MHEEGQRADRRAGVKSHSGGFQPHAVPAKAPGKDDLMEKFADKVAIVTGGASGLGRALCEELGGRGAAVVAADINADGARETVSAVTGAGGRASATHTDTSQEDAVQKLVDDTVAAHGQLDYMFNNAGIGVGGDYRDMTLEHWRRVIDVNLWGVIYGTTAAYRVMVKQGFGHIVNTASLAGLIPVPTETAYATTKHAVVGLSTSLRAEAADLGVKVSVVCPGFVQTGIFDAAIVLKIDRDEMIGTLPTKMIDVTRAARVILRGVARNRARIVFPFGYRVVWWLSRFHPALVSPISRKVLNDVRRLRQDS